MLAVSLEFLFQSAIFYFLIGAFFLVLFWNKKGIRNFLLPIILLLGLVVVLGLEKKDHDEQLVDQVQDTSDIEETIDDGWRYYRDFDWLAFRPVDSTSMKSAQRQNQYARIRRNQSGEIQSAELMLSDRTISFVRDDAGNYISNLYFVGGAKFESHGESYLQIGINRVFCLMSRRRGADAKIANRTLKTFNRIENGFELHSVGVKEKYYALSQKECLSFILSNPEKAVWGGEIASTNSYDTFSFNEDTLVKKAHQLWKDGAVVNGQKIEKGEWSEHVERIKINSESPFLSALMHL